MQMSAHQHRLEPASSPQLQMATATFARRDYVRLGSEAA